MQYRENRLKGFIVEESPEVIKIAKMNG